LYKHEERPKPAIFVEIKIGEGIMMALSDKANRITHLLIVN
jgi:hypothetical protein